MNIRDLRAYARQTTVRLAAGMILLLFIVGDGLIYWFYGPGAAVTGLLCLGGAFLPLILIAGAMLLMEWIVKRANRE